MQTRHRTDVIIRLCNSGDADYAAVVAINNANFPEFPTSLEEMRHDDKRRPEQCKHARWVAESNGQVVGYTEYGQHLGTYNPRKFELELAVHPDHYGRGIGRQLYNALIEGLRPFDPIRVASYARQDMPWRMRFFEQRGFTSNYRFWSSELDLRTFDPAPFAHLVAEAEAQGFVFRTLAELRAAAARDEVNFKLFDLWRAINADVPIPPEDELQQRSFEEWCLRNLNHPSVSEDDYLIALDGERGEDYIGRSDLWRAPEAGVMRTGMTGVRRAYRRRGLAMALKVLSLARAKEHGHTRVMTENASLNVGMLAINDRLGFQRKPEWLHYTAEWSRASSPDHAHLR